MHSDAAARQATPEEIKCRVEDALRQCADVESGHIKVEVNGSDVTLRGEVGSLAERNRAQERAWSAPGVILVTNQLRVRT